MFVNDIILVSCHVISCPNEPKSLKISLKGLVMVYLKTSDNLLNFIRIFPFKEQICL